MPQSPRGMIGTAIHKLFERASTNPFFELSEKSLSGEWDEAMEEAEQFAVPPYMEGLLPMTGAFQISG